MSSALAQLQKDMLHGRQTLATVLARLERLVLTETSDEASCAHVALTLQHTYSAAENILKAIAATFEGVPTGEKWHKQLLDAMAEPVADRPAVLSPDVHPHLDELRRFRHYLIHGSVIEQPTAGRLLPLRQATLGCAQYLQRDLDGFAAFIDALVAVA